MPKPEKTAVVEEIRTKLDDADAAVLTEYRGLSVRALAELRGSLRPANAEYKVFKNRLDRGFRIFRIFRARGVTTVATKLSTEELLDVFKSMSVLELNEFLKAFEEEFDVTAAAPVAVAGPAAGAPAAGDGAAEEQDEFD